MSSHPKFTTIIEILEYQRQKPSVAKVRETETRDAVAYKKYE